MAAIAPASVTDSHMDFSLPPEIDALRLKVRDFVAPST